jgi:hypothetical protein
VTRGGYHRGGWCHLGCRCNIAGSRQEGAARTQTVSGNLHATQPSADSAEVEAVSQGYSHLSTTRCGRCPPPRCQPVCSASEINTLPTSSPLSPHYPDLCCAQATHSGLTRDGASPGHMQPTLSLSYSCRQPQAARCRAGFKVCSLLNRQLLKGKPDTALARAGGQVERQ